MFYFLPLPFFDLSHDLAERDRIRSNEEWLARMRNEQANTIARSQTVLRETHESLGLVDCLC
jgi:hypothetical protein